MKTTFRLGLLAVLVALTLMGVGGISLAAGDLFDKAYSDCPHNTRFRDGQISDLSVSRDSEEEAEVNVSWAATDPVTWGLGPNAYRTSLVVILDDGGDLETQTMSLGSRKVTFEGVDTGVEVTVQMAIVVDTADGDYLISDILEASTFQSLTKPSFSTSEFKQYIVTRSDLDDASVSADDVVGTEVIPEALDGLSKVQAVTGGLFYYVGYNENFGNYKADSGLQTRPSTARLRVGLRHGGETDDHREDVEFDAYILRIEDSDGNVVSEGDDVATRENNYGALKIVLGEAGESSPAEVLVGDAGSRTHPTGDSGTDLTPEAALEAATDLTEEERNDKGWVIRTVEVAGGPDTKHVQFAGFNVVTSASVREAALTDVDARNVRINDDGEVLPVNLVRSGPNIGFTRISLPTSDGLTVARVEGLPETSEVAGTNRVFVEPPDEYRDFPIDVFETDETYTISAWAINEDNEVISPIATLTVRPKDKDGTLTPPGMLEDYVFDNNSVNGLTITEFTVLK